MTDFRYFPRVFGDVMDAVRAVYISPGETAPDGVKPVYEFGTYLELTKVSALKDDNKLTKYPLVWLVWEATESKRTWDNKNKYSLSPRLFICTSTNSDWSSVRRYSESFEKVLFPIWELIKEEMANNENIDLFSSLNFEEQDHLYWGESIGIEKSKNKLFDTLDAFEVNFKKLEIFKTC